MAKAETTTARVPRGTKPVSQAFFTALEAIPEASRAAVAKAAQAMIRDQIKAQREKAKAAAAKEKARKPAPEKPAKENTAPNVEEMPPVEAAPKKGRLRKVAKAPAAA